MKPQQVGPGDVAMLRHPSPIGAMPRVLVAGVPVAGALVRPVMRYAAHEVRTAEAIALMLTGRPVFRLMTLAVMPVLWVAACASLLWLFGFGRGNPRPADVIAMTVRALTAMRGSGDPAHEEGFGGACEA